MQNFLDFEKPLLDIKSKIEELRHLKDSSENIANELSNLQDKYDKTLNELYDNLTPIQKVKVCRHQDRPKFSDIITEIFDKFEIISGDRLFAEDCSIKGGLAKLNEKNYLVIGNDKGNDIDSRVKNNFGMAKPEGYRKAQRLYSLADKFNIPVVTFVDTPGAFPGVEAEDRGQSEAIASSIRCSINVKSPIFSFIIGEGGSGGAVALATGNKVVMLEHSIYSVISPEGCASILWRSANESEKAAESLKLTAQDLFELGVIDEILKEPLGGAHRNLKKTCDSIKESLVKFTNEYEGLSSENIILQREKKYLSIGKEFLLS
jgi:acetyl-CoA carboxylase carboxyl transferase subunit alpha